MGVILVTIDPTTTHCQKAMAHIKVAFDKAGEWHLVVYRMNPASFRFPVARNRAYRSLPEDADPIFALVDDYFLHEDDILVSLKAKADIVGPQVYNEDGTRVLASGAYLYWQGDDPYGTFMTDEITEETPRQYGDFMMRRKVFDELGGFYEGYTYYYADPDLCNFAVKRGYTISYMPTKMRSFTPGTTIRTKPDFLQKMRADMDIYRRRWHPAFGQFCAQAALRVF